MNSLNEMELEQINGGYSADGAITEFGAALAADGLNYMESGNVIKSSLGTFVAAGGGWIWAFGSAYDGISSLFN